MSPQKEDGYTAIANEIMEALAKYRLPGESVQCLFVILRKTYGYHKKADPISITQFEKSTGLSRKSITRALSFMASINIISVKKHRGENAPISTSIYSFNKHYDDWKDRVKKAPNRGKNGITIGAFSPHTKVIITKEKDILTNILSPNSENIFQFSKNFIEFIKKDKGNLAPSSKNLLLESCKVVDKLIRLDRFDLEYIRAVLLWAVEDSFWGDNVFSLASLRDKKKGDPRTKFQKIAAAYESSLKPKKINGRSEQNKQACVNFIKSMMEEPDYEEQ